MCKALISRLSVLSDRIIFLLIVYILISVNVSAQPVKNSKKISPSDKVIGKDDKDSTLAASCVRDSKTGDIILKMVNPGTESKIIRVDLAGFRKVIPDAEQTVLSGDADAENTFENPGKIVPVSGIFRVGKAFEYAAPAMSMTVIRIKTDI